MLKANFFYTGEFGIVYRALYSPNSDFTSIPQPVAVKTLKGLLFTITLYTNTASCLYNVYYSLFIFTILSIFISLFTSKFGHDDFIYI